MATGQPRRILDADGRIDDEQADEDSHADGDAVARSYRYQVLARELDAKARSLSRQGRVGTYAPLRGQEAVQTGAAVALDDADLCFPTYRDHALYLARGVPPRDVFVHLMGRGNYVDRMDAPRTFPPTIPIATHLPHAVGAGVAAARHGESTAVLVSFGDGATSEGDFHEALNFAGVSDAPVVFCCQNNGWAISTPFDRQTAAATVAQKAEAYGIRGERVDGNDVLAVSGAVADALDRARAGDGPTLLEAVTYRRGAHTTTDDPDRYRDPEEVPAWLRADPIERTRGYLERRHGWSDEDEQALQEWAERTVSEAVAAAESLDAPAVEEAFAHVFADPPPRLAAQRDGAARRHGPGAADGDGA